MGCAKKDTEKGLSEASFHAGSCFVKRVLQKRLFLERLTIIYFRNLQERLSVAYDDELDNNALLF